MTPAMQTALKKAAVAALAAGVAVFFKEYPKEQERIDKEAEKSGALATIAARSLGRR